MSLNTSLKTKRTTVHPDPTTPVRRTVLAGRCRVERAHLRDGHVVSVTNLRGIGYVAVTGLGNGRKRRGHVVDNIRLVQRRRIAVARLGKRSIGTRPHDTVLGRVNYIAVPNLRGGGERPAIGTHTKPLRERRPVGGTSLGSRQTVVRSLLSRNSRVAAHALGNGGIVGRTRLTHGGILATARLNQGSVVILGKTGKTARAFNHHFSDETSRSPKTNKLNDHHDNSARTRPCRRFGVNSNLPYVKLKRDKE